MSEPSKFAVEASKAIYQADAMGDDITYAGIVQRAIDAARADLREQMTGLRRALVSEEGKTKAYQDRVTELEALVSLAKTNWKAREATYSNSMDAIEAIAKERKERIVALEELLERTMQVFKDNLNVPESRQIRHDYEQLKGGDVK